MNMRHHYEDKRPRKPSVPDLEPTELVVLTSSLTKYVEARGSIELEPILSVDRHKKWRQPLHSERSLLQMVLTNRKPILSFTKLVVPDKKTRDVAVLGLRRFLVSTAEKPMDKLEMDKLWKGIFYCLSV